MGPCFRRDDVPKGSIHFKHASPPRRADAPELLQELPPRGRGECRMPDAPAASCAHIGSEYAHEYSQRAPESPGIPARNGLRLISCSPRRPAFLPQSLCGLNPPNLTPASGRQDHTTSPSVTAQFVRANVGAAALYVHRIPPQRS
jgi:hypothetical protein